MEPMNVSRALVRAHSTVTSAAIANTAREQRFFFRVQEPMSLGFPSLGAAIGALACLAPRSKSSHKVPIPFASGVFEVRRGN